MKFVRMQVVTGLLYPMLLIIYLIRKLPLSWGFRTRMDIDGIDRPYYAYGLYQAALEAKALGIKRISTCEFGVASGAGLVVLENLAHEISKLTGIKIDVYGFDLAHGLPKHSDYRDVPYIWRKGFYKMDVPALKKIIRPSTRLVLGDVKKTVPAFSKTAFAPLGFIAFDLDYYSSTKDAFKLFDAVYQKMLPRVYCYFDDIIGTDEEIMCDYVGELLAIREFNREHAWKKIAKINGLFYKRAIKMPWTDMVYVLHNFRHPQYDTYIYHTRDRQAALT